MSITVNILNNSIVTSSSSGSNYKICLNDSSVEDFITVFSEGFTLIPESYANMAEQLGLTRRETLASVPRQVLKSVVQKFSDYFEDIIGTKSGENYYRYYFEQNAFLNSLNNPSFNVGLLQGLIDKTPHDNTKLSIEKFKSNQKSVYSQSSTVTGRLTVKSGPNILTAPAPIRKCFKAEPGRVIAQIDLKSAEPKFALQFMQKPAPDDVYGYLKSEFFNDKLTRQQVKILVLSALYGQSTKKIASSLPSGMSATKLVEKISDFFSTRKLFKKISESHDGGKIFNAFGRPIKMQGRLDKNLCINYFLQSSIAELSVLMFSDFCKDNHSVKPIYVIHDALIIDADSKYIEALGKKVNLSYENWNLSASVSILSNI